ncbi:restriction endonuclease subunit S [Mitsuokella jalaludinii]|uniref:restriction endonuclease subunit S n=1 Tax=Mitsuokella jalaludinii TaxID=187979 RepID=UPI003077371D
MCVNDIIIGRRGEMGRTAPVGADEAGWLCGTGCMLLRLKKEYDAKFYSLVIASQQSKQYLETHAVGSTMKNLNEKIIRNLPVPVYSYAEQQEIVAILDRLLGREEEVRQSAESVLAAIDSMKQSILARAFRGELGA